MKLDNKIYLDHNATTPVDPRVLESMLPYFTHKFANAGSDHIFGWDANDAVEQAREQLAALLNCRPGEIIFTSGATEAANLALLGFAGANKHKGNHIITARTEHKAILDTLGFLERQGFDITYLEVNPQGNIDLDQLEEAITFKTILVCLMLANNETGLIHPVKDISKITERKGVKFMSDITQGVGKIPVDLKELDVDLAVLSAHKIYGPKGAGALYINKKNKLDIEPQIYGGKQEKGMRAGTQNVPAIVGFGKAAEIALKEMKEEVTRIENLRNRLEALLEEIEEVTINSKSAARLPNTTNVTFKNTDGSHLLRKLNSLAVSRGSACNSNLLKPSHVLKAMGISDELALSSLRISPGRQTTEADIDKAAAEIKKVVDELRIVRA
ncbi:cysteine desulfurase [Antarcticibacterium flavum]|uniref:cysteine desulfurase n=1 Tax=Antarcticibacterium flavum TaxID=2058175 RepID=A0A5B7X2S3_9FLAO|nr:MULTISPECIES: cysteine desulfurase family protein [Antarcticibacterium]MCM4161125.1 IscS subfamily cysteine desulfurase [Antarcticibacterium sp. W02-3]QCY69375.1 cysteine desulfurase [Antarcticibacterium flavum]